jgi:5-methylcytosine-specific restriction endonuclease McrA
VCRYTGGCRCVKCREEHRLRIQRYVAERKQREPGWNMGGRRKRPTVLCVHCGKPMKVNRYAVDPCHASCRSAYDRRVARISRVQAKLDTAAVGTSDNHLWTQGLCGRCGQDFCIKGTFPARYCTRSCKTRDGQSRRRAREANAFVSHVNRAKVFTADGYRCHLCRKLCNQMVTVPHPNAPTVDHVIPLARGGTHEPSNCRTACFKCNCMKRDRGGGEQLLLLA